MRLKKGYVRRVREVGPVLHIIATNTGSATSLEAVVGGQDPQRRGRGRRVGALRCGKVKVEPRRGPIPGGPMKE